MTDNQTPVASDAAQETTINVSKVVTILVVTAGLAFALTVGSLRAEIPEIPATIPGELSVDKLRPAQPSFMRQKLGSTNKIVEGLAVENFPLIIEGTDELLHLAEEASWRVRRDEYYMYYSRDFKETVRELQDAAKARNLERATFAYNHATLSCTVCHRHVRGVVKTSR